MSILIGALDNLPDGDADVIAVLYRYIYLMRFNFRQHAPGSSQPSKYNLA
jgi:hypothetical protein